MMGKCADWEKWTFGVVCIVGVALGTAAVFAQTSETAPSTFPLFGSSTAESETARNGAREIDVLIDARHANDFSDVPFSSLEINYHRIYSFRRAFENLAALGVRIERFEGPEPLDAALLARCGVLFLNLPSPEKAPFLLSEIVAIKEFIENGGAAFFIVEHSNCYFHARLLTPLFNELDVVAQEATVCDATRKLGDGVGWIYFDEFAERPVTQGVKRIAFQTGGPVDPRWAVAWSSEKSWADAPNVPLYGEASLDFLGNLEPEKREFVGRQGVVLAKNFGRGKIVAVGDQNMFSRFFFNYLDNDRLWFNAFAWILDRPELANVAAVRAKTIKTEVVLCWEELSQTPTTKRFGDPDANGYYHLFAHLNRKRVAVAVADVERADEWKTNVALLIGGGENASDAALAFAFRQIKSGRTLIVLDPESNVLTNDKTLVYKLLRKLAENEIAPNETPVFNETSLKARIDFANGGRLTLIRGAENSFDNSSVPKPERRFAPREVANLQPALDEIEDAFGVEND